MGFMIDIDKELDIKNVKIGDNVFVIGYPNNSKVTIESKIRDKTDFSITLWWGGGEFTISNKDIKFIGSAKSKVSYNSNNYINNMN
jgi:hypothetical protein